MPDTLVATSARSLVAPEFFERLSRRVALVNVIGPETADRITEQALAFLATCATRKADAGALSPSPAVDLGWHCFLEYTKEYDYFFESHGWPKVQHVPFDEQGRTYEPSGVVIPRTVAAMKKAGFQVDSDLWEASSVSCGGDDSDGKQGDPLPCGDHG